MFIKKLSANNESVESDYSYENNNNGNYNVYAQFVPGHVADVITSKDHYLYKSLGNNDLYLNAIKASAYYGDETDSKIYDHIAGDIYIPLLRGIVDVPIRGDQVLLCEFGDIKYYIGPLNTINSPNFNPDLLLDLDQSDIDSDDRRKLNISPGFIWHPPYSQNVNRLEKVANADLDFSGKDDEFVANNPVGDIILEGRFGNSIRLGSRADHPHIFISNGRSGGGSVESLNDETLISITSAGSISDHFNTDKFNRGRKSGDFLLASNQNEKRIIDFNDVDTSQIFINTDKITFNSRIHEITLSSGNNINIGSNNDLNISTNNSTIIESRNIYLGTHKSQPLVLGDELRKILKLFVKAVMGLKTTANAPAISGPPDPSTLSALGDILKALQTPEQTPFLSKFHFIENNDTQK